MSDIIKVVSEKEMNQFLRKKTYIILDISPQVDKKNHTTKYIFDFWRKTRNFLKTDKMQVGCLYCVSGPSTGEKIRYTHIHMKLPSHHHTYIVFKNKRDAYCIIKNRESESEKHEYEFLFFSTMLGAKYEHQLCQMVGKWKQGEFGDMTMLDVFKMALLWA